MLAVDVMLALARSKNVYWEVRLEHNYVLSIRPTARFGYDDPSSQKLEL